MGTLAFVEKWFPTGTKMYTYWSFGLEIFIFLLVCRHHPRFLDAILVKIEITAILASNLLKAQKY
ncbi:hypothetical protein SDJN02_18799, partial [Cucurbita argyrosperma subsp. argyrosperma]